MFSKLPLSVSLEQVSKWAGTEWGASDIRWKSTKKWVIIEENKEIKWVIIGEKVASEW